MLAASVVAGMAILAARIVYAIRPSLSLAISDAPFYSDTHERRINERRVIDATIETIRRNRLYALCTVLVAFLHVTYFTAFAIGIHDRGGGHDLQSNRPRPSTTTSERTSQTPCDSLQPMEVVTVYFPLAAASMDCTDDTVRHLLANHLERSYCTHNPVARTVLLKELGATSGCHGHTPNYYTASNADALLRLTALFRRLAIADEGSVLVELRGHADTTPPRPIDSRLVYFSNAELAKQRAQNVETSLRALVKESTAGIVPIEIEWKTYGVASENSFLDPTRRYSPREGYRSVEVQVVHRPERTLRQEIRALATHDRLDLLDYIYFTVYTITTTGYGDIIPLSSFARFVVSIANLYELFFVAIIFNIVAAAGHD